MKKIITLFIVVSIMISILYFPVLAKEDSYLVAISQFAEHGSLDNCREGLMEGLAQEGFIEGENLLINFQNAQADMALANQIAQSQASQQPDVMVAIATPMAQAAFVAGKAKDIPVVYSAITDPVAAGLADETGLAPGEITGTSDKLPIEPQLKMIRALMPEAKKIGILYTLSEANSVSAVKEYETLSEKYNFEIVAQGVAAGNEIALALDGLLSKVDCLTNLTDNTVVDYLPLVLSKAEAHGKPVFGSEVEQVKLGCAASEGLEYVSLGIQTGKLVARILKGENAIDIPFERIEESELYVNMAVLERYGLILTEELRERANEVYDDIEQNN